MSVTINTVYHYQKAESGTYTNYGDTSVGTPNETEYSIFITYYGPFTVTTGGEVQSVHKYIGTLAATSMTVAIYSDATGTPGSIISNGTSQANSSLSGSAWNTFTFSTKPTVASSTAYWVGVLRNDNNNEWNSIGGPYEVWNEIAESLPATASGSQTFDNVESVDCYIRVLA